MRVTNAMLKNNMMLGLNKNMGKLNTLYDQMNSLKKIQRPSDDPIILGRSLKLRLNVLETEQYKTNVGEARSWMEISEKALDNSNEILNAIRTECSQAANGTLKVEDRQKITAVVDQLKKQLIQEANANYAGRSVFAGYKTDEKVLFEKEQTMTPPADFKQEFSKSDVETVGYRENDYYRMRLAYGEVDYNPADPADPTNPAGSNLEFNVPPGVGVKVITSDHIFYNGDLVKKADVEKLIEDEIKAGTYKPPTESTYHPPKGTAYFLQDTGELILSKEDYGDMDNNTKWGISYQKTNFKEGDPNPKVFFNTEPGIDPPLYTSTLDQSKKNPQKLEYEIGIGTKLDVNVLGNTIFTPTLLRDIDEMLRLTGLYDQAEEEVNGKAFTYTDVDGKEIETKIITRSPKDTINLSKLFTSGLGNTDKALKQLSGQVADLGSRMKRLDITEKRLGDDEVTFTELLSRTEDVELERVYIDFNTQYAVYQSALQATAKVVQPTLMDFLR